MRSDQYHWFLPVLSLPIGSYIESYKVIPKKELLRSLWVVLCMVLVLVKLAQARLSPELFR